MEVYKNMASTLSAKKRLPRLAAAADLAIGDIVYETSSGTWDKADSDGSGTYPALGVVTKAALTADYPEVCKAATLQGYTGLTVGGQVYLSTTAAGITQSRPTAGTQAVQSLGFAVSATKIEFDICAAHIITGS